MLRVGLNAFGISLKDSQHSSVAGSDIDLSRPRALCVIYKSIGCAIRRINGKWFNLNSLYSSPRHVSDFYLNAYMAQLRGEGYRAISPEVYPRSIVTSFRIESNSLHSESCGGQQEKVSFTQSKAADVDPEVAAICGKFERFESVEYHVVEENEKQDDEDEDMENYQSDRSTETFATRVRAPTDDASSERRRRTMTTTKSS